MGAQDWVNDLTDASGDDNDDDDGGSAPSLFEENFRKMIDDDEIGTMAVSTLEEQVERIDDIEILKTAVEQDDRDEAEEIYRNRIGEINTDDETTDQEDDSSTETSEEAADGDEDGDGDVDGEADETDGLSESAVSDESGPSEDGGSVEGDVLNDLVDEDESEGQETGADDAVSESEPEDDPDPSPEPESEQGGAEEASETSSDDGSDLPDIDVSSLAPSAVSREEAADAEKARTMLVWGPEGSGKSHVAHSAPEPIAYIDTEGKASELADKFDKEIVYWEADDYKEAKNAMDEAFDLLDAYLDAGVRGTLVVDSMTAMWEYAKVDYAKFAYQTEDLSDVKFQSELEGEKDWTKIKGRHNDSFREPILESPFHVVFTSGQKEDYNGVFDGEGKAWVPDGEKWNKYAVKDVVRLRRSGDGKTVADLRKAARTRYSFVGLEWPEFDDVYGAIEEIYEAEQAPEPVDVSQWEFEIVDGQPIDNGADGSEDGDDDE